MLCARKYERITFVQTPQPALANVAVKGKFALNTYDLLCINGSKLGTPN